ncbi:MAG: hypothetical protein FJW20_02650 [Acidimicrobiia bacterium]|nr:hypothetical protein [Acidimicrobiia bacterium]
MLVILVPVVFGLMGFAVDLGRIYMIRGELKTAANSIALAAAAQLAGTDASLDDAQAAAQLAAREGGGFANRYDYGGRPIGEATGNLNSEIQEAAFFETVEAATGTGDGGGGEAGGGTLARHVRIRIQSDAPLLFWSFLSLGLDRRTPVLVEAVAGHSAPLCTACGDVAPIAVAALDPGDDTEFGFVPGTLYTLGYQCSALPIPQPLPGSIQRLPFLLINRLNEEAELFPDEATQTFRIGAGGLPATTNEAVSCLTVNAVEGIWASAAALPCNMNRVPTQIQSLLCGLGMRLESGLLAACENIAEVAAAAAPYAPDSNVENVETYEAYTGNRRRVLTIPIVLELTDPQAMTVLGLRQFLLQPQPNTTNLNPNDENGRFLVTYIGSTVPLRQGRFSGCTVTTGPGKVVLHR